MKLLVVNTAPSRRNGITNVAFNLLKAIDKNDSLIGYVSVTEIAEEYKCILRDLDVKHFVLKRSIKHPYSYIKKLAIIAKGYDVIHVHGNSATMVLEMLAAKIAKVPLRIAHSHNTTCRMKVIDKIMRPLFNRLCNGRLACGADAGQWLHGNKEFLVVNNGVDTDKFQFNLESREKIREDLGWKYNTILANIANFVEAKNHEFLIEVFSKIYKVQDNTRLLLLGAGPLMDKAKQQAKSLGIYDRILFAGSVPNISQYLSAIDLIVMPSKFEGLPLTLVEEQANGLKAFVSTAVTKDADMTGQLTFLPLDKGADFWTDEILKYLNRCIDRTESYSMKSIDKIKKSGYDINSSAQKLKLYYTTKLKKING